MPALLPPALPPPTALASRIFLALVIGAAGGAHVALATGLFVGLWAVPIVLGVAIAAFAFVMLSKPRRAGERPGGVTLCAVLMAAAFVQAAVALAIQVSPSTLRLLSAGAFLLGYGFAAVGLWRMWPAGLRIAIAVAGLSIAVALYSITIRPAYWTAHLGRIVLMVLACACLLKSVTREAFEPS